GKDVAAGVQVFDVAASLFGRHVPGSAHDRAVTGHDVGFGGIAGDSGLFWLFEDCYVRISFARSARNVAAQDFGEAPVHHKDFAEGADHDVCGLQVAVENAARMREGDGIANAQKNAQTVGD